MKIRFIYSEKSEKIEDMSRDRVHLNLSYGEWRKLKNFIDWAKLELKNDSFLKSKARNLVTMFNKAQNLEPIWTKD